MRNLKTGHLVEYVLWLALVVFLYVYSFDFDQPIEIYKFGASSWPRVILLLVVVAATGQLLNHLLRDNGKPTGMSAAATDDGAEQSAAEQQHNTPSWYTWTIVLLALPIAYTLVPEWIATDKASLGPIKIITAAVLLAIYLFVARGNHVGAILALPVFFAVGLQDFGFYALAPLFIPGIMYLMGERRGVRMFLVTLATYAFMLILFVSILYVGLPTGNIPPFYDLGTTMVTIFQ